ncbi:MAG: hypothetical protein ABH874_06170 [Methanobacteriota archaeon]
MGSLEDLRDLLNETINNEKLASELAKHFLNILQRFRLGRYEDVGGEYTKFVETSIQILHLLAWSKIPDANKINLNETMKKIENESQLPESIRLIIPRLLFATQTIRSKRGLVHKSEVDPNYIDTSLIVKTAKWIIAEFIRIGTHIKPQREIEVIINDLLKREIPLVQKIGEDTLVLDPKIKPLDELLLILYVNPEGKSTAYLKKQVHYSNIHVLCERAEKERYIHRGEVIRLTDRGGIYIEKKFGNQLLALK